RAALDAAWDPARWVRVPRAMVPGAIQEREAPRHWCLLHPMGVPLRLESNHPGVLSAAERTLGRFSLQRGAAGPPLLLRVMVHDVEPACAHETGRQPVVYRTHGHLLYVTAGAANTAVADLLGGQAFGFVTPAMVADAAYLRYAFLEGLAFSLLATTRGFIPFHAACVVKAGQSLVLGGKAGAGKSTLAYACARRGYQILAEDAFFLEPGSEGARLWGLPWRLHLLPDAKRFFPELDAEVPHLQINGEWKLEVDVEAYHPGAITPDAAPGLVILLARDEEASPSRFEAVPLDEARAHFQAVWPWWVGWREGMDRAITRLLAGRTYRLWMNGSPDEAVDALDALLARQEEDWT
ncbi:MAG: hypothetical protein PVG11_02390, partial [Anaerolineae bacterium]